MTFFKFLVCAFFIFFDASLVYSQQRTDSLAQSYESIYKTRAGLAIGGTLDFTTPQKYGATIHLTIGKIIEAGIAPGRITKKIRGVNLEYGVFRGGYRFGFYYTDIRNSMVGPVGPRIGFVYLKNNSFSRVLKSTDLIGFETEFHALYKIKIGVLKSIDENRYIPSLGFGFGLGPVF